MSNYSGVAVRLLAWLSKQASCMVLIQVGLALPVWYNSCTYRFSVTGNSVCMYSSSTTQLAVYRKAVNLLQLVLFPAMGRHCIGAQSSLLSVCNPVTNHRYGNKTRTQVCPASSACCRADIVNVQNTRLDRFHVKEHMQRANEDIQSGRIIQSMQIEKQTAALREAIRAPLMKAKDLLVKDIHEHDDMMDGSLE